jgi:hypothetical protein
MERYAHMAGMWIVGEDMPQESNAITLHPSEKDGERDASTAGSSGMRK